MDAPRSNAEDNTASTQLCDAAIAITRLTKGSGLTNMLYHKRIASGTTASEGLGSLISGCGSEAEQKQEAGSRSRQAGRAARKQTLGILSGHRV